MVGGNSEEPFVEISSINEVWNYLKQLDDEQSAKAFQVQQCAAVFEQFNHVKGISRKFYRHRKPETCIIFSITEYPSSKEGINLQEIGLYSHEKDAAELENSLNRTEVVDFGKFILYLGMDSAFSPAFKNSAKLRNGEMLDWGPVTYTAVLPNEAARFDLNTHDELFCRPLNAEEAWTAYKHWRYRKTQKFEVFCSQVTQLPSMGVFLKRDNRLVSWIILNDWGQMSCLFTLEEYRKKGYARLAVKALSVELSKRHLISCACIEDYNLASTACFKSLGFQTIGRQRVMTFVPFDLPKDVRDLQKFFIGDDEENEQ